MLRIEITRRARRDIGDIYDYGVESFGQDTTESYVAMLMRATERLAEFPGIGQVITNRSDTIWRLSCGSHVIVYRIDAETVLVARILHQSMDFNRHV